MKNMYQKIKGLLDFLSDVFIILGILLLMQQYVFGFGQVFGKSMEPNLTEGQKVVIDKITYTFAEPQRFDIVAVKFSQADDFWVKRVIGLPGEKVEFRNNQLFINEKKIEEPFLKETVNTTDFSTINFFPNTAGIIPENNYLVMGDNRSNSKDGRKLGTLTKEDIIGVARFTIYPFDRIGFLTNEFALVKENNNE